jgi:MipA family protein
MMLTYRSRAVPLLALCSLLHAASAAAEEPVWELGIGGAGFVWPAYPGSEELTMWAIPYPYVVYRGDFVRADGDDVSGMLFDSDRVELDFSGSGTPRVRSDKVPLRADMPDVNFSFELGPSLRFIVVRGERDYVTAALNLRGLASIDFPRLGYEGLLFNPTVQWERALHPDVDVGLNLNSRYADRRYHDYFYAVPEAYATEERPAYSASHGYNGTHLAVFATYRPSRNWRLRGVLGYRNLAGAAVRDSPLFERDHGTYLSLTASYIFLRSSKMVTPPDDER